MNQRYHMPVDPACPAVLEYAKSLLEDPLTHAIEVR